MEGFVKFFDSKYRLFGVINVIDLIVVLAILVGGFAVYRALSPKPVNPVAGSAQGGGTDFTYQIYCASIRYASADQVKVGDTVSKATGKAIGVVTGVKVVPSSVDAYDGTLQKFVPAPSGVLKDVLIDVKSNGQPTASGVVVGDLPLHSNQQVPIITSTFESDNAIITNLQIAGK